MGWYLAGSLIINILAIVISFHWSRKHHKGLHTQCATRAFHTCNHCHHLVGKYFIDGYGRTTCKTCKPEGFADAEKRGVLIG